MSTAPPADPRRGRTAAGVALRIAVVVLVAAAGAFAVLGFGLAHLLEADGFGVPADTGPRTGHLVGYGAGALLGVAVPALVAWLLLPRGRRWVLAVARRPGPGPSGRLAG